jgi:hypothetical protein
LPAAVIAKSAIAAFDPYYKDIIAWNIAHHTGPMTDDEAAQYAFYIALIAMGLFIASCILMHCIYKYFSTRKDRAAYKQLRKELKSDAIRRELQMAEFAAAQRNRAADRLANG